MLNKKAVPAKAGKGKKPVVKTPVDSDDIIQQQEQDEIKELKACFGESAPEDVRGLRVLCLELAGYLKSATKQRDAYMQDAWRYQEVRNQAQLDREWLNGNGKFSIPYLHPESNEANLSKDMLFDALFDVAIDHALKLRNWGVS